MPNRNTEEVENDPLIGKRLASYEILRRVAQGGMGVVYRARHVYIDKVVALKVLDPELSKRDDLIDRFRTEAQSLARVEHENVVKVIDIIEEEGVHFIVMDFAEGQNLRNYVKDHGPMSESDLVSAARQTAEALYAAHKTGILHRDIKPENIIRNSRGRCKLADFGLAGDLRLISEGHEGLLNFGTPAYSAPEILRRMKPDVRSDVFAYGASLYFAATGDPPFGKTGTQQIMMRQKQGTELLEARRPDLSPALCKLIHDCLNLHPKDRPPDFRDVLAALPSRNSTRVRGGTATSTRPSSPTTSTGLDSRNLDTAPTETGDGNRGMIVGIVVAVVVIGFVGVLAMMQLFSGSDNAANAASADIPDKVPGTPPRNVTNKPAETNSPPDNQPVEPTFRPIDQAFGAAQLDSRSALANADYASAYKTWSDFAERFPDSELSNQAREEMQEIAERVKTLRQRAIETAENEVKPALKSGSTSEAMEALGRFPAELRELLGENDSFPEADKLESLNRQILATEASALAGVLKNADRFRDDWTKKYRNPKSGKRTQRLYAGRLLDEQQLLKQFISGRLADTQETVNERLASIRKLLEAAHQESSEIVNARRTYNDTTRPEQAIIAETAIKTARTKAADRKFADADEALSQALKTVRENRSTIAQKMPDSVQQMVLDDELLIRNLQRIRHEFSLAASINQALQDRFSELLATGRVVEISVYKGLDSDGKRKGQLASIEGRVSEAESDHAIVNKKRVSYDMIRDSDVSSLLRNSQDYRSVQVLAAWATALGKTKQAEVALKRMEKIDFTPTSRIKDVQRWVDDGELAMLENRQIIFLASWGNSEDSLDTSSLESQLLTAMRLVLKGEADAGQNYLKIIRELALPELANLRVLGLALDSTESTIDDLRIQATLEPENPDVVWQLSQAHFEAGEKQAAKETAKKALWLDPSLEAAWEFLRSKK